MAFLCIAVGWRSPASAEVSDSYTLQITENDTDFSVTVNGLPVAERRGVSLAAVPYFLEAFLHDGDNEVLVSTRTAGNGARIELRLTAPAPGPLADGQELGRAQCGLRQPGQAAKACAAMQDFRFVVGRQHAPALHLWGAEDAAPGGLTAGEAARCLAALQAAALADARRSDWRALYFLDDLRRDDLLAAGGSTLPVLRQMAIFMDTAERNHPGMAAGAAPPAPADLLVSPLPHNLFLVRRRDGRPILRVQVGDGSVEGTGHVLDVDPRDSGDQADRFITGAMQLETAIYGRYSGQWRLVR